MKYLACDLDGTLVQNDEIINEEDINAILKLKEEAHKFIISTGRSLEGIHKIFNKYPEIEYDYIVACNGSIIIDNNDNVIYDNFITSEVAEEVFREFIDEDGICVHFEHEGSNYLIDPEDFSGIEHLMDYFKGVISKEDVFSKKRNYSIISLFAKNMDIDKAEEAKNLLIKKYGHAVEAFRNQYFVDIAPKDCSKGNGLKKLLELNNLDIEKLYAIGDSYNDLSMFNLTNNSFTFHHVEEQLKGYANNHVSSVSECIEKMLR
ncbi:MAG: Cof-type HAD-IIB family hydrolase [Clostridium sp.]|uniref:Cof-type HAD-IIB family hydrolase n=1 Tax=Clostridium sp. TaxID=1506 RepID=UPI0029019B2A|nr:Cof-type HAD-IIB family hydrolase [Clostridium sp.]MDU2682543.1 Cof-type HAD-IIB family hydrolase [Clostridium sp.]